jgi:hypothetical protein
MIRCSSKFSMRCTRFRTKLRCSVIANAQARETHSRNEAYLPKSTARKQLYSAGFSSMARKSRRHSA